MKYFLEEIPMLTAKAATGIGTPQLVKDWQHVLFALSSQSSANLTIKFQGSFSKDCPDFSAAKSATNRWDYIQVKDYQNNGAIDGDTGISFSGTDDVRLLELNTNGCNWVCVEVTARAAGSVNVMLSAYSNN